jgi:hypothetical protein
MLLLRNGVFLGRINSFEIRRYERDAEVRLVFLGRPTAWKGVSFILELALVPVLANTKLLFFFPYKHADLFKNIPV